MNLTIAARRLLLTSPFLAAINTDVAAFSRRIHLPSAGGFIGRTAATTEFSTTRAFTSTSPRHMANVLKLSDPQTELLDEVDVFIFDCDGVIWRVSTYF